MADDKQKVVEHEGGPLADGKQQADEHEGTPVAQRGGSEADAGRLDHLTSPRLLVAVFLALAMLTAATVAVTAIDLGSTGNFVAAMVIATVKAGLVIAFFMHLWWDRPFNGLVFLTAFLFLVLFLGLAVADRKEYQEDIDQFETISRLP